MRPSLRSVYAASGLVLALLLAPSVATAIAIHFTAVVTEVIEDPLGTIEFPGVTAGDPIDGSFDFTDSEHFTIAVDIGPTSALVDGSFFSADAALDVSSTRISGFGGTDEFQMFIDVGDPTADFLADRGTAIPTDGYATNSLRFTEGAFDTIVRAEVQTVKLPIPEPGAAALFSAGLCVVGIEARRRRS